jgi:hypothetical protein
MASKSKRRPNWGPILWLLIGVNTALGLAYSPITSATQVEVVGARQSDQGRLRDALKGLADKPALSSKVGVLADIHRRPDLYRAELSQNIFGRAKLTVTYDQPVAVLADRPNVVLTASGILAATTDIPENLPKLRLFEGAIDHLAAYSGRWNPREIADVCQRVSGTALDGTTVTVAASGNVRLQLRSGATVKIGAVEALAAKFEQLDRALEMRPDAFKRGVELNLVVPDKPAFGNAEDIE